MAHRRELVVQAYDTFQNVWAEQPVGTATPERADGQSILELFQECAHRLDLKTAIRIGELVPIRCVRVKTNVDLSRVRFNQVQYNRKDIEKTVLIPPRDKLIVQTYLKHVRGSRAVVFCVNVRHGESVAELFRREGVAASLVSGRMSKRDREQCLREFRAGALQVLCACDILNEGWDCPEVEVLMMARPTLSKVIYLQQLGRGTRKSPGKECLIVFDFIDNASRYNQSLNVHRALNTRRYRPGGFVAAPDDLMQQEEDRLMRGEKPTSILEIGIWAREYQEIDLFNWQEAVVGMISVTELEVELATSQGYIGRAIERGEIVPDHTLTIGDRTHYYFLRESIEAVCDALGIERIGAHNIKDRFLQFVKRMDMAASYKPVMLLAVLDCLNARGVARLDEVVGNFRQFYEDRSRRGLVVESQSASMARVQCLDDAEIQRVLIQSPFEKFERRTFLEYDPRDLARIRFAPTLWRQLRAENLTELRTTCEQKITAY